MLDKKNGMSCELGCWALAAGAGVLIFILLLVLGSSSVIAAIFLGGLALGVTGFLLTIVCCAPLPAAGEVVPGQDRGLHATPPAEAPVKKTPATAAPSPSAPAPSAPPAPTVPASAVKPSTPLPGQDDLAARKGEWRYEGAEPAAPAAEVGTKPTTLTAARDTGPDDLKKIKGVGPKLEELLHSMGFFHFDQIAAWTDKEVAWVDDNLEGFKGRVTRDEWVAQARQFAAEG